MTNLIDMNPYVSRKFFPCIILMVISHSWNVLAQTQDDFTAKLSDVYVNANDKKKALDIAKDLYNMVEKQKDLQTYSNYATLTIVFESQTPDPDLAKACKEKSDKLLAVMTGTSPGFTYGSDANSKWMNEYYPALFSRTDPENAIKAAQFLSKNPSLQTFNNLTYVAYAFERNGDFEKAKENYEKALTKKGNEKEEFHSYSYYTSFLVRSGDYLQAEEYIKKMEKLSEEANDMFKASYKSEALVTKPNYYLSVGDYSSYLKAANEEFDHFTKMTQNVTGFCDTYTMTRYTVSAHAKEMLKEYQTADQLWKKSDSSQYAWLDCNNKKYPQYKQYPLSMVPVYKIKTGNRRSIDKPVSYYIQETNAHFDSYKQYAELRTNFMKGVHLAFLGASQYHTILKSVMDKVVATKDFSESTLPLSYYAYFTMRDRQFDKADQTYDQLFRVNIDWVNDVIFSFGEKAFVTYYNAKLKDGYDNYHSFVKIAKEKKSNLFPELASQAYNNLLFTKSLSLKGTKKRKQAFRKANDPAILKMYDDWIDKKQQLIRHYRKAEEAQPAEKTINDDQLKKLQEEVNHLENELATKAKDFKKYLKLDPPDWKTIRAQLKESEAAIEMIRFQWRDQVYYSDSIYYAAYYITKNSQHPDVIYLPASANDLENKYYNRYQNSIKFKLKDNESYQQYWKPIMDQLKGIKKIYFSPDGVFHLINVPTLFNPESGKYLLDEIDVQSVTSSIDVQSQTPGTDLKHAVLFGRPSYEVTTGSTAQTSIPADTRSFVANFKENNISDLPGTEEEVLTIKKEMDNRGLNVNIYLRDQATEDKMYSLHSPDIIHIATHGYWSQAGDGATDGYRLFNAMANSGLLMSGVVNYYRKDEYADTYDGILTAYEAQNLDLDNTALVILSACETSLGHMDAGEGVYGLQRAFRAAGAKSIMTSLWKVDDAATKEFMILFYQHYLQSRNKFEAFTIAQKKLKEKYAEPYFWGAFTLIGN